MKRLKCCFFADLSLFLLDGMKSSCNTAPMQMEIYAGRMPVSRDRSSGYSQFDQLCLCLKEPFTAVDVKITTSVKKALKKNVLELPIHASR